MTCAVLHFLQATSYYINVCLNISLLQTSVEELRARCAVYMREHRDNFLPFLCHPDTGDMYTEPQFEEYCDKVQNTSEWGGHLEVS